MEVLIIVANNIQNPYNLAVCKRLLMLDCVQNNRLELLEKSKNFDDYYRIKNDLKFMSKKGLNRVAIPVNRPGVLDSDLFAEYKLYRFELIKWEIGIGTKQDLMWGDRYTVHATLFPRVIKLNGDNGGVDWKKGFNRYVNKQLRNIKGGLREYFVLRCDKRGFLNRFNFEDYKSISLIKD
jgi:hypothetical protein